MDTRAWGPSGWQLLHLIAHDYPSNANGMTRRRYEIFFNTIKDILPCKFCRESTTQFMQELDLHTAMKNNHTLSKWMYDIHNRVNKKLRDQCKEDPRIICPDDDPEFSKVQKKYTELLEIQPNAPPGMDFLFCIAFNYPKDITSDKVQIYFDFFMNLYDIFPYANLRKIYQNHVDHHIIYNALQSRDKLIRWLYSIMYAMSIETNSDYLPTLRGTYQRYGYYMSGCKRGKTCRNGKKIRDHKKTYKVTHARLIKL